MKRRPTTRSPIELPPPAPKLCVYCGQPRGKVKRGEHVVQEKLGGRVCIKRVCGKCNGKLSIIDQEFVSRSPLAFTAATYLGNPLECAWAISATPPHVLVETRPDLVSGKGFHLPQMHFDGQGVQFYGDQADMEAVGRDQFASTICRLARRAFREHEKGKKGWLHFHRIDIDRERLEETRFHPRAFFTASLPDLREQLTREGKVSLRIRYRNTEEKNRVLNALDDWRWDTGVRMIDDGPRRARVNPRVFSSWDGEQVVRALLKVAANVAHFVGGESRVQLDAGDNAIILGDRGFGAPLLKRVGFVPPDALQSIADPDGGHSFRVGNLRNGRIAVYMSFFGGKVAAVAMLLGRMTVDWTNCDVLAPLCSADWRIATSTIHLPIDTKPVWGDIGKVVTQVGQINVRSRIEIQPRSPKRKRGR